MKDYLAQYSQKNFISHLSLLSVSFILALGLYFYAGDSGMNKYLKTNIQEASIGTEQRADIELVVDPADKAHLLLRSNANIQQAKAFSISFSYNPENLSIISMDGLMNNADVQNISNDTGINTIFLQYPYAIDIKKGDYLLLVKTKKTLQKLEHVNIINANFKDITGENYILSTSGTDL